MDIRVLQQAINARGYKPALDIDGVAGKATMLAVDSLVKKHVSTNVLLGWPDARKRIAVEQIIFKDIGIETGEIDGLVGEQTRYARTVYDARLKAGNLEKPVAKVELWRDEKTVVQPVKAAGSPWPSQSGVSKFFGAHGTNQVSVVLPFPQRIAWEPQKQVLRTSCNAKVAEPLKRIWKLTLDHYGIAEIRRLRLDMFGGCFNDRKMRGGSSWSMHAFGIAWDVDPDRNQLKWKRANASLDDAPYAPFWRIVESEGALSLGRERDYDWMHFQFTRDLK